MSPASTRRAGSWTTPPVIAAVELRRFLRDRSNIFFVFLFPLILVLLIGAQFGSGVSQGAALVVGDDPGRSGLMGSMVRTLREQDVEVKTVDPDDRDDAMEQVARGRADVVVVVDDAADQAYAEGRSVELSVVASPQAAAQTAVQQVQVALQRVESVEGQRAALARAGVPDDDIGEALTWARTAVRTPSLTVERVDELAKQFEGLGQFDFGAAGELLLFVFLASLTGSTTLIQARRLGVIARTLAAPVTTAQVVGGQVLGRFAIAMFQGTYIMAATALLFDVNWGNLAVSLTVLSLFALVAAGAAMVLGAVFDNEGAAAGVGVGLGLVLAALGGSMLPLELFPDTMRQVSRLTPHAWASEAFAEIQRRDGGFADVLPQLGVLAAMAVAMLLLGSWVLRRSLARAM